MSLHYPHLATPPKGLAAFDRIAEDTTPSQAAVLLALGNQMRGGELPLRARAAALKRKGFVGEEPKSDFPVPKLRAVEGAVSFGDSLARLQKLHAYKPRKRAARYVTQSYENAYRDCAERVFKKPVATNAADLFALCLDHPKALVRIAAAIASLPLTTRPQQNLRALVSGLKSDDELERSLAATGLARTYPDHPALRRLSRGKTARRVKRRRNTSLLIHGTWASDNPWYQPGGDFFKHIRSRRADLYGAADFFKWSGGWSDGARQTGAVELRQWVESRNEQGLDLIGHSHGANLMLKATDLGLVIGKAVLLSCPVHVDKYFPNFAHLQAPIFSVRVHMDLVILADGGGQRFSHPEIKEIVLPIWFDHSATHEPQVWIDNNLAHKISL
jgi:hypothetical protein